MTLSSMQLMLWEGFACTLFYSCFCRASHTSKRNTVREIRWAFTLLGVVAIVCIVAPVYDWHPDGVTLALLASIAIVQIATAHHWRNGLPRQFSADCAPKRGSGP